MHYMLPATERLPDVMQLIAQQSYFVLHAPRQTGKTTAMLSFAQELTATGRWTVALLSVEGGAPFSDNPGAAEAAILDEWRLAAQWQLSPDIAPPDWPAADPGARLGAALSCWAASSPRPLVLFLDEIDAQHSLLTCSAEDLIVHKAFAAPPQDWLDIQGVVARFGSQLPWAQIWDELEPLVELKEEPAILDRLRAIQAGRLGA